MQLTKGTQFGPYEIIAPLGAGGMGEVYRARDTRLRRIVALKILPTLSASGDLRVRFEREARAISALNHPNICALYDMGRENGTDYIVMEYLEGHTLAERIARGPLPLSQTLRYGIEIGEALQQAHRSGVVHRDLKPGNVVITSGGAKLVDFGLAQTLQQSVHTHAHESSSTTDVAPLTAEGRIQGTLHYMSPEQIEGKTVDPRSDIFSLGILLYEMATGRHPFEGASRASIVAAILSNDPPPIRSLRPATPPTLERVISVALEKDPERRWQSAQDVAQQLHWIGENPASRDAPGHRRWLRSATIIAVTMLFAAVGSWIAARRFAGVGQQIQATQLDIELPPDLDLSHGPDLEPFAISPDGRTLAIVARRARARALYVRRLDSVDLLPVEGSEDASSPFWSSDGKWLGFSARGKLWKTNVSGVARPEPICDVAAAGATASWVGDTILFADIPGGGSGTIFRVSSGGGPASAVTCPTKAEWRCSWPQLLPDGRHFLYVSSVRSSPERLLMIATLDSTKRSILVRDASHGRPVGNDQIVYVRDGTLLAQRIDAERGITIQDSSRIAENLSWFAMTAKADFDVSANGVVVYATDTTSARLVIADRRGGERIVDEKGLFYDLAISPDGKQAAVSIYAGQSRRSDLWIYDLAHGIRDRFTTDAGAETGPVWSPDGQTIVYSSAQEGLPRLARRGVYASAAQYLLPESGYQFGGSFSPDGANIYYSQRDERRRMHIYRVPLAAAARPQLVVGSDSNEQDPRLSPDGKWLAFQSDLTGDAQVYILNLASKERTPLTMGGGVAPRWRRDGRELFCISSHAVVSVIPGIDGNWHEATSTTLFPLKAMVEGFDATPDGQSFLLSEWTPGPTDHLIHVITGAIPH